MIFVSSQVNACISGFDLLLSTYSKWLCIDQFRSYLVYMYMAHLHITHFPNLIILIVNIRPRIPQGIKIKIRLLCSMLTFRPQAFVKTTDLHKILCKFDVLTKACGRNVNIEHNKRILIVTKFMLYVSQQISNHASWENFSHISCKPNVYLPLCITPIPIPFESPMFSN